MRQRRIISFLLVSLFSILGLSITLYFESFDSLDRSLWDWRLKQNARLLKPNPKIKIIQIDDASIEHYAKEEAISWPWPREIYSLVIAFLERAGAKALAIDLLYTESSKVGVEDDYRFAQGLSGKLPVVLALAASQKGEPRTVEAKTVLDVKQASALQYFSLSAKHDLFMPVRSITPPIPELLTTPSDLGSVNAVLDRDGIVRRYALGVQYDGVPILALGPALLQAGGYNIPEQYIRESINSDRLLTLAFPATEPGYEKYSIRDVIDSSRALDQGLKPTIPLETFKDSFVFLGAYAYGLLDLRPTPLSEQAAGVEVNAVALDNILSRKLFREAPLWLNLVLSGLLVMCAAALLLLPSRVIDQVLGIAGLVAAVIAVALITTFYGIRIEMGSMVVWLVISTIFSLVYSYYFEGGQYRFIKRAFAQYLSPEVVDEIARQPELLQLGGERKQLTMLFSDIEGFTAISETLPPADLSGLLNRYLSTFTDIILESGGTLDKYIGDAVVAFWNAPLPLENHASHGVDAALRCQEKLSEMRVALSNEFGVMLRSRIGIHTGDVVVGNFGSERRFAYTMLGDSANLASRLEGANKAFGTQIIISGATRSALGDEFYCRRIGSAKVVGRKDIVEIFEPFRVPLSAELKSVLSNFEEGLKAFEAGEILKARTIFGRLKKDAVAKAYLERINHEFGLENAPVTAASGWSSVWALTEK